MLVAKIFVLWICNLSSVFGRSNQLFIRNENLFYQVNDGSLELLSSEEYHGVSSVGEYEAEVSFYAEEGSSDVLMSFETQRFTIAENVEARIYIQSFPNGLTNASTGDRNCLISGGPCLDIDLENSASQGDDLIGFWSLGDYMFGWMQQAFGIWGNLTDMTNIASGLKSGPLLLFDKKKQQTTILTRLDNFLVSHSAFHMSADNSTAQLCWGIMGNVSSVPENFSVSFIEITIEGYLSPRLAFEKWGEIMTDYYGKTKSALERDLSVNYLGYYTDNGAYYYYTTELNKTYEQTVDDIMAHSQSQNIPYRYFQYDSWFYPKDPTYDGVVQWVALEEVFPDNLTASYERNMWPVVAHNRYFSPQTVYAKQNGGAFDFVVEQNIAIPLDQSFWTFLLQQSRPWGLVTYEQDWQNLILEQSVASTSTLDVAPTMFSQMGAAASALGVNIQYCMALPKSALHSLLSTAVSQGRVSDDYQPGNDQWTIGETSMFAWAMHVAPFKDTFWSSTYQPGNTYGESEPSPSVHAVVSTLSCGPVAPGDRVGFENKTLIMRSVNEQGLILKPNRPAFAVDKQILQQSGVISDGPQGQVWTTFSQVSSHVHGIIFGANLKSDYTLSVADFGFHINSESVVFDADLNFISSLVYNPVVHLKTSSLPDFTLLYTSPKVVMGIGSGVYVLGDLTKWVPMSNKRFDRIATRFDDVILEVRGGPEERVTVSFLLEGEETDKFESVAVSCEMNSAGRNTMHLKTKSCVE